MLYYYTDVQISSALEDYYVVSVKRLVAFQINHNLGKVIMECLDMFYGVFSIELLFTIKTL